MSDHLTPSQVRTEAQRLLDEHGLTDWRVVFDTAKARAGQCSHTRRTLSFSRVLMAARTAEGTRDTIAHEVAHAVVGHAAGHGPRWQKKYIALGGSGRTHWSPETLVRPEVIYRWAYTCVACQKVIGQSIRKRDFSRKVTRCCRGEIGYHRINAPV